MNLSFLRRGGPLAVLLLLLPPTACLELAQFPEPEDATGDVSGHDTRSGDTLGADVRRRSAITYVGPTSTGGCVLDDAGAVWCWGDNTLGLVATPASQVLMTPQLRADIPALASLSIPFRPHACGVTRDDARVVCWGENTDGQSGATPLGPPAAPTDVPLPGPVAQVASGSDATCALLRDGAIYCWGRPLDGNDYDPQTASATPSRVMTIDPDADYDTLCAASSFACAGAGDALRCWGWLAVEFKAPEGADLSLPAGHEVEALSCGNGHACAVTRDSDGETHVLCFGGNYVSQGGQPAHEQTLFDPAPISNARFEAPPTAVSAGWRHTCALDGSGAVRCWGLSVIGVTGQLPEGRVDSVPLPVAGVDDAVLLGGGTTEACVVTDDQRVLCWGGNERGQLGTATADDLSHVTPVEILIPR